MLSEIGWEKFHNTRNLRQFLVHGGDEGLLVLSENRSPFLLCPQVHKEFCVKESGRIRSIVGPANL